jgi:glutaconate CoA-transferase subunit A
MEQMIPFSTAHEIIRQKKRGLTLIGPISDCLFDQLIGAGCVEKVIAAWVGNVMMGSAYNFRRATEVENPGTPGEKLRVFNLTNFSVALALQAGAMGVPFLPTRTAQGSDVPKGNHFYYQIFSPFEGPGERPASPGPGEPDARAEHGVAKPLRMEPLLAVRAIVPDVTIAHVQRSDEDGNAHCWGNFGVLLEGVRAAKKVIVVAEEIVSREVIASDPNRTIIPGFLVSAVVHSPLGAHPSPVQGYYKRDDDFFAQYHRESKTAEDYARYRAKWIDGVKDVREYAELLGKERVASLGVKKHAYAAPVDYGY